MVGIAIDHDYTYTTVQEGIHGCTHVKCEWIYFSFLTLIFRRFLVLQITFTQQQNLLQIQYPIHYYIKQD